MAKRQKGKSFAEKLLGAAPGDGDDLSAIAMAGLTKTEITGNREVIIDGCKGILEYDEGVVKINTGSLVVKITGANLTIISMNSDQAVITGDIAGAEFSS